MPVIVGTILTAAGKAVLHILGTAATQSFLEWTFFWAAGKLVKRTDTPHDNEFYDKIKAAHDAAGKAGG